MNVYDTMYSSIPPSTVDTVARLAFCSSSTLTIRMVEVDLQRNSSDYGVLSIAMAFDSLASQAPCVAKYDQELIGQHLCDCLSKCLFFFLQRESSLSQVLNTSALLTSRSFACANYLIIPESNGQSVNGVLVGFTVTVWIFQTVFFSRHASRGNAQLARAPTH